MKVNVLYFDSEIEYKEQLITIILDGKVQEIIMRGRKEYYLPTVFNQICRNHKLHIDTSKFFIVLLQKETDKNYSKIYYDKIKLEVG